MRKLLLAILPCLLLSACSSTDKILADVPSPDGAHHAQVRECDDRASRGNTYITVSVLKAGVEEACNARINAIISFDSCLPNDKLELEWRSNSELRAWHQCFAQRQWAPDGSTRPASPVVVVFEPAKAAAQSGPLPAWVGCKYGEGEHGSMCGRKSAK